MNRRSFAAAVAALVLAVPGGGGGTGAGARGMDRASHRGRASRPAGHLGERLGDPARAAGRARRQGVPDRRGGGDPAVACGHAVQRRDRRGVRRERVPGRPRRPAGLPVGRRGDRGEPRGDRQLQPVLADRPLVRQPDVPHRRPPERPPARPDGGGGGPARGRAQPRAAALPEGTGGSRRRAAVQRRAHPHDRPRLQQQLPDPADGRPRRDPDGDDARHAHHPPRRLGPRDRAPRRPRRVARPLGGGHAGGGNDEHEAGGRRIDAGPAAPRALHPGRPRDPRLRVHDGGSEHLDAALDGAHLHAARPGTGVIYEFACHEGNYALEHTLRGARLQEVGRIAP